jgi:hypothetical protein
VQIRNSWWPSPLADNFKQTPEQTSGEGKLTTTKAEALAAIQPAKFEGTNHRRVLAAFQYQKSKI